MTLGKSLILSGSQPLLIKWDQEYAPHHGVVLGIEGGHICEVWHHVCLLDVFTWVCNEHLKFTVLQMNCPFIVFVSSVNDISILPVARAQILRLVFDLSLCLFTPYTNSVSSTFKIYPEFNQHLIMPTGSNCHPLLFGLWPHSLLNGFLAPSSNHFIYFQQAARVSLAKQSQKMPVFCSSSAHLSSCSQHMPLHL